MDFTVVFFGPDRACLEASFRYVLGHEVRMEELAICSVTRPERVVCTNGFISCV